MKLSENYFVLFIYFSEMIVIYTFRRMFSRLHLELLVEHGYFNENLNHTLYSISGVDWIKGTLKPVNSANVPVSTIYESSFTRNLNYLFLLDIYQRPKQKYIFSLFNIQYILLSSGIDQNVMGVSSWCNG